MPDTSNGYDSIVGEYAASRTGIGANLVHEWAKASLPRGARILDAGCGTGVPITERLISDGFDVYATDASASMIDAFRQRFPNVPARRETVQDGSFFNLEFDAIVAIGLIFLLPEEEQIRALANCAQALKSGGVLLFSAPWQEGEWDDNLTGRRSVSLGKERYLGVVAGVGLDFVQCHCDEGNNHYYEARKPRA